MPGGDVTLASLITVGTVMALGGGGWLWSIVKGKNDKG
jgi:hypothetical protein